MKIITVYFNNTYTDGSTFTVQDGLTKQEITKLVDKKYKTWYAYDIDNENTEISE